jgi:type II secretory pathway component PulJ
VKKRIGKKVKRIRNRRRRGVSILEMLVTLLLVAMIIAAVLEVLQSTGQQIDRLTQEMTQRALIQASLDKLMEDISLAGKDQATLQVTDDASKLV